GDLTRWFGGAGTHEGGEVAGSRIQELINPLLFHRHDRQASGMLNSGLRQHDQQWRISAQAGTADAYREEVLLVGRASPRHGAAETLTADPAMPTRLWLGALPGEGAVRPPLAGLLTQETFVRVYIPVRRDS